MGPVCWGSCPADFPYNCGGVTCTKDSDACTSLVAKCVIVGPETILTVASCIGAFAVPNPGSIAACVVETFGNVMMIGEIVEMFDPVWMCDGVAT